MNITVTVYVRGLKLGGAVSWLDVDWHWRQLGPDIL
jgi:hypothetical protein